MPRCPKCGFEYREDITTCGDCGVELTGQNPNSELEQRSGRRSCASYGCITVVIFVLIMTVWIGSGFIFWKKCRIPLPDSSGSVYYMARLNKIFCAEWDRKISIETNRIHGKDRWVLGDGGGADPIYVYWYPAKGGSGPYLRLQDPIDQCIVDLKNGITLWIRYYKDDDAYAGEISSPWPEVGFIEDSSKDEIVDTVDGHPVRKLEHFTAYNKGRYIGRIEYPFNRFVSSKEAPEKALPKHQY